MLRKIVGTFALLLSIDVVAAEYIDPAAKEFDEKRQAIISKGIAACDAKKFKTVGENRDCVSAYHVEAREKYPSRGTVEYAKKMYSNLSAAEGEATLQALFELYQKVEGNYSKRPGVIRRSELVKEAEWIHKNVLGTRGTLGDPWFIECKDHKTAGVVRRCPLGSGGAE